MKKYFKLAQCALAFLVAFTSCNSDEVISQNDEVQLQPQEFLNITYKGEVYKNIPTTYDENGDFVFLDNIFSNIYEKELKENTNLSIVARDPQNIILYEDFQTACDSEGIILIKEIPNIEASYNTLNSRAGYEDLASVTLYDDRDFKDRNYTFVLNDTVKATEVVDLKKSPWKFNDKCSSLILTNNLPNDPNKKLMLGSYEYACTDIDVVFIGYDDKGFTDRTITCIAPTAQVKKYASLPGFNDKMSSFKLFFAQKGQYQASF